MKLSRLLYFLFCLIFTIFISPKVFSAEINESWMNIYSGPDDISNPIGYSYSKVEKNAEKTVAYEESEINIKVFQTENKVSTKAKYELTGDKLQAFNYSLESFPQNFKIKGERKDGKLLIATFTGSGSTEKLLEIGDNFIIPPLVPTWLSNGRLTAGANYEIIIFDPFMVASNFPKEKLISKINVLGKESIQIDTEKIEAFKVNFNFFGADSQFWIKEDGTIVKEIIPPGLVSLRSTKNNVVGRRLKGFDIVGKTSIVANKKISKPRESKYLKFKLNEIDYDGLNIVDNYSQFKNGSVYEIKIKDIENEAPASTASDSNEYLLPTNFVQSSNQKIKSQEESITKGNKNKIEGIKAINTWVYEEVEKTPVLNVPNSLDVLNSKKGDCNEHAVLFAALARSYGVPTKIALGLVYLDGRFSYHAWNEVYLGRWVPVDSTFGQFPSDATHIKLVEGGIENSIEIVKLVGKLNIQILEVY